MIFEMQVITAFLNDIKELKVGEKVTFKTKDDVFSIERTKDFFEVEDNIYNDGELANTFIDFWKAMQDIKRFVEK